MTIYYGKSMYAKIINTTLLSVDIHTTP